MDIKWLNVFFLNQKHVKVNKFINAPIIPGLMLKNVDLTLQMTKVAFVSMQIINVKKR